MNSVVIAHRDVNTIGSSSQRRLQAKQRCRQLYIVDSESSNDEVAPSSKYQRLSKPMSDKMRGKQRAIIDDSTDEAQAVNTTNVAQLISDEDFARRLFEEEQMQLRHDQELRESEKAMAHRLFEQEQLLLQRGQEDRDENEALTTQLAEVHASPDQMIAESHEAPVVDLLEDNELERLDNEDRKFGEIEAPPLRPREKQGPSGRTKKLKRKAVFYSTEIEHMDDNLLKTIMAQYIVVMVDPNHQTRDD